MPTDDGGWAYSDYLDPFSASIFPQCYALAATTVVAYMLVIMLFVTPRSFLDGGVVVLGRRGGFTNSGTGPTIGGRPWLQKVAALAVAISLTIASAATFAAAAEQYRFGVQNAKVLQQEVLGGNELKIIRIISNTFLWLAQAQTLIRLFPRQREKIIIKWTAFALITLDVIFQCLNSFKFEPGIARPGSFSHPVPALAYLFALSLGVLYAAWVIYYSFLKKRYAYWHPQMKNMTLMAALSLLSILIPIVFFIVDLREPDLASWGEYVRWVGAAAASVVVWEWVERIEALEREEKNDGVLGREVFDGDEMLELTRSKPGLGRRRKGDYDEGIKEGSFESGRHESPSSGRGNRWPTVTAMTARYRPRPRPRRAARPGGPANTQSSNHDRIHFVQPPLWPARPQQAVTPISRTDTASAASTVYAVRYHTLTETTSRTPPPTQNPGPLSRSNSTASSRDDGETPTDAGDTPSQPAQTGPAPPPPTPPPPPSSSRWRALSLRIPFQTPRQPADLERAVSAAPTTTAEENSATRRDGSSSNSKGDSSSSSNSGGSGSNKWDVRSRLEDFAATQAERLRDKFRATPDTDSLPVTVIPAPPRPGAALARLLEEEGGEEEEERRRAGARAAGAAASVRSGASARVAPPPPPVGEESRPQLRPGLARSEGGSVAGGARRLSVPMAFPPARAEEEGQVGGGRSSVLDRQPSGNLPPPPPPGPPPDSGPPSS